MPQHAARAGSAHPSPRPQRKERTFNFDFPACDKLPPPVLPFIGVSFSYSGKKEEYLCAPAGHAAVRCVLTKASLRYENLNLGIDCDSRIALVGPNGACCCV